MPTLGKRELTLFLMKIQTSSVYELGPLFTIFYHEFVFKQGTIRHGIFKKIETKRQCCAKYIGSDSNAATQV